MLAFNKAIIERAMARPDVSGHVLLHAERNDLHRHPARRPPRSAPGPSIERDSLPSISRPFHFPRRGPPPTPAAPRRDSLAHRAAAPPRAQSAVSVAVSRSIPTATSDTITHTAT
ncbi:hypothetical protein ACX83H_12680 [Burkholderia pseudomallei]|uniref:Uncharacterized protein n=1 Tax=Burkholderia pseudomallei TaxID=28450 RepID=A0A8A4DNH1_BURPE|nr:hypothetical protein [Burkholderia pseudomallei]MCE2034405.1 hypothetical protein [Burkholderia pseudomallei CS]MCE2040402.1 hypothetical protein [Burkholderia pseudomallei CB]MCE2046602.1 hypothetical protein [Burkholderia pseudomallei OS]MCE2052643.1 hypothetical protein [Burkholderia pseudomallei OB]MBF3393204.1 hypothetical protein [Burkholderia pseudomallei]